MISIGRERLVLHAGYKKETVPQLQFDYIIRIAID